LTFPHNNHQKSFWDPLQQKINYEQSNNENKETNNTVYWVHLVRLSATEMQMWVWLVMQTLRGHTGYSWKTQIKLN
jgi:hypothetical protein